MNNQTPHARRFMPTYGPNQFCNHVPMAVVALRKLGASPKRIADFERRQDPHLTSAIGNADYQDQVDSALARVESHCFSALFANDYQALLKMPSAGAFHGMIRTAYGILGDDNLEIAAGLHYWTSLIPPPVFEPIQGDDFSNLNADQQLALIRERHGNQLPIECAAPSVSERMAFIASQPAFRKTLSEIAAAPPPQLHDIARVALRIFAATNDFTALHAVTGTHAARVLSEHLAPPQREELRQSLWLAIISAWLAIGAPAGRRLELGAGVTWDQVKEQAVRSDDDHDIKLVFSCWEEFQHYGGEAYLAAAAFRMAT